jgi:hypothetical protein
VLREPLQREVLRISRAVIIVPSDTIDDEDVGSGGVLKRAEEDTAT